MHLHLNCTLQNCHARIQMACIYYLQQLNKFSFEHVTEQQTWWQQHVFFSNLTDLALYRLNYYSVYSDMASKTLFPEFKTTGDDKHDLETYIEDLTDYCIMQNWLDPSKETDTLKWTSLIKAWHVSGHLYLRQRERFINTAWVWMKPTKRSLIVLSPHWESITALALECQGEWQKFLHSLQNENESIAPWEMRVRNQAAQCEYEGFADELTRDQFIAGLTSDTLRVKLIGKGHKHKKHCPKKGYTTRSCRSCQDVRSNCVHESAHENCQEHTTGTSEFYKQINICKSATKSEASTAIVTVFLVWRQPSTALSTATAKHLAKDVESGISGHFARVCRGGARRQGRQQQSNLVDEDNGEKAFVMDCETPSQPARKFFAHLHLIHGEKTKVVKAQIDSASTGNTIPISLLSEVFPNIKISQTRSKINTYGSETMRTEGQATLCCDRRGKIHTIDFLVVNVPDQKPPPLSGREHKPWVQCIWRLTNEWPKYLLVYL